MPKTVLFSINLNLVTLGPDQIFGLSHRAWESIMLNGTEGSSRKGLKLISQLLRLPDDIVPEATYSALRSYYAATNIELQNILPWDLRVLGYSSTE